MLLVTTSILLLSTGMSAITGLSKAVREPGALNASMLRAMAHESVDPAVRTAFSAMQIEVLTYYNLMLKILVNEI